MAEAPATEADAESGGKGKLIAIVGVVVVVVLAAVYFLVLAPKGDEASAEPTEVAPMFAMDPGTILPVDDTTVSLGGNEPHFAQIAYSAVLSVDVVEPGLVEGEFDRLRSRTQLVLRGYTAELLNTADGLLKLQDDLSAVAHELWPDGEVVEVLVTSLLVQ